MSETRSDDDWVERVLDFWFRELAARDWFRKSDALDALIVRRYAGLCERLALALPEACERSPRAALAGVVVLDQFPRNMFRGSPQAYANDTAALRLAMRAIDRKFDLSLATPERMFLYMPFQHSEDRAVQARSVELFAGLGDADTLDYARRHQAIIDRFGRFPHRNAVLGRPTTAEEAEFLRQPGSSF